MMDGAHYIVTETLVNFMDNVNTYVTYICEHEMTIPFYVHFFCRFV